MFFKTIKEVFPNLSEKLERVCGGDRVIDLLFHKPRDLINRRNFKTVKQAKEGEKVSIVISITSNSNSFFRKPYKIRCVDKNRDLLEIVFFHKNFYQQKLKVNTTYILIGTITNGNQVVHPEKILPPDEFLKLPPIESIYSLTEGITNYTISSVIRKIIPKIPVLHEWIDEKIIRNNSWESWRNSLKSIHFPNSNEDFEKARRRLAYDEIIAFYLALKKVQDKILSIKKDRIIGDGKLRNQLLKNFKFELTDDQKIVSGEIYKLQNSDERGMVLLQGDVGSGKTIVAFLAMLNAVECGKQCVLLVPTSVLAKQHFETLSHLMPDIAIELLIGGISKKNRNQMVAKIASGYTRIIIGTHAILVDDVYFKDLSLVVIDEQHRFGASQRTKLLERNEESDLLLMTATPIPRTMAQMLFGSICSLTIKSKPKNRKKIDTIIIKKSKIDDLLLRLKKVINDGSKVFWVCPLVEDNENINAVSVEERFDYLRKHFKKDIDFIHGALKGNIVNEKIENFRKNILKIILSTTVIEVGVDIPDADIIVIENAERFGLAQLHQLRGRVGRGLKKSFCVLIYDELNVTEQAVQRLKILKDSDDGFYIAERDCELRGSGDILGIKQSGFLNFKFVDERKDRDLFDFASVQVRGIIKSNSVSKYESLIKMFFSAKNYYL